jgi:ATP-dependent helicase/nuclease subunit B
VSAGVLPSRPPRVFSIPAGVAFLEALAARLLAESGGDPLILAAYRVLLPTRRACRGLQEAFLRLSEGRPLLLPRLEPLGDVDADELILAGGDGPEPAGGLDLELAPAIAALRRQVLLARAIQKAGHNFGSRPLAIDQAARLAAELARLLDQMTTEQVGFESLAGIAGDHAEHWQRTVTFLEVLSHVWPTMLAAEGALDPAERRNRLLAAEALRLRRHPPATPIIAAGSTGSIPATADLLAAIAGLPHGRVVLPGLDRAADAETWAAIEADPNHPQHGMALLLQRFGLAPGEVEEWPAEGIARPPASRQRIIAEALRPAATTAAWGTLAGEIDRDRAALALRGIERVDCPTSEEEAGVIALRLRQALEVPGKRAALVTHDRSLARRVAGELRRWNIEIDDSAGRPLAATPPGVFLRLVADMIAARAAPAALLALLKHPLAALGRAPADCRRLARRLERELLRGPRPRPGLKTLARAPHLDAGLKAFLQDLAAAGEELARLMSRARVLPAELLARHVELAQRLAASDGAAGAARLWAGEAGEGLAEFLAELAAALADHPPIPGDRWPALLDSLIAGQVLRPRYGRHPRLAIWGPLEARLQSADLIILAGLNEGSWPQSLPVDPWFSRPMRKSLGLAALERRIGQAAHDFAQAWCAAPELMLTRALRVEGAPTVPSRWLLRLDSLLRLIGLEPETLHAGVWLGWHATLDRPAHVRPAPSPAPRPPVAARPQRLSVTEIETWLRDPYAIYARRVLKLEPLDPLDADPTAADRGSFIHDALEAFTKAFPQGLPEDAVARLLDLGRRAFGEALDRPALRAFWWPRFERIATWFVERERLRRPLLAAPTAEAKGELFLQLPGCRPFRLSAKADRIDRLRDGSLVILDYKTGRVPGARQIEAGYAPQLPLEAAMAAAGAFEGVAGAPVAALEYWRLQGGRDIGEIVTLAGAPADLAAGAMARLSQLIAAFEDPAMPYLPVPDPDFLPAFGAYDHLSRRGEWAAGPVGPGLTP